MAKNHKIPKCPPLRFPDFNDEWTQTTLGEISRNISSGKDKLSEKGNYHLYGSRGLLGHTETKSYTSNIILVARVGANAGEVIWVSEPCGVTDNALIIEQDNDSYLKANSRFIFMRLLSAELNKLSFGSGQPLITASMLKAYTLALPSLAEQKRIADFLSLIDERIESCSETIKERKREKAALLNQLFSQKLRFPQFSDEWQQTMLGEIAEILNSRRKPITSSDRVRGDYPYYGASGIIDYVNEYIFDEQLLLIGEDGAKWGKDEKTAFIVSGRCWVNNHAHVLRFQNYPTYKLIEAFFFSLNLKPFVTGDAPPKLTLENLKSILIHFPSLAEQEKIADFLSLIDERIEVEEELLEQYERQKRYLLKQMFI